MSKKVSRALASGMVMSLVVTTALTTGQVKAAAGAVTRTSGLDRYATAAEVATTNWSTGATDVVLVSGEGYADAVSASVLAKKLNAPILLTTPETLNAYTKLALETLGPTNVYIIGGNASVSQGIRNQLKASYNLIELKGANRYETNLAVANKLVELGVDPSNTLLVGGEGFSDALSVAPVAASKGEILLLGNNNSSTMSSVVRFVEANNSSVTVVGTSNVINEGIYNKLGAVERVNGGATRFQTNINVLNRFDSDLKADRLYVANASGDGYADALVASALAGKTASPLVLVNYTGSDETIEAISYIRNKAKATTDLSVIGGAGVVSQSTVDAINNAVNPSNTNTNTGTNGDNTVSSVEAISLNQFEIKFNTNVDEDTAELTSNYKVAGEQLDDDNAHVELINNNTVRITLVPDEFDISQGNEKSVSVKKGILTEDKTETIETYTEKIEFKDITAPTLKSVSVRGNNKVVIEFSEAVNMENLDKVANLIKVDGSTLSNYNKTYSEIKEAATNGDETWANKVEFYLNSGLDSGEITVKIKDSDNDILEDAAGFGFKETEETVTVDDVDTEPEIQDITCTDNGVVRIKFDRPMDTKTALNSDYYQINDEDLDDATFEFEDDDTVVKISDIDSDILEDNTNVLSMTDNVKDAYGNKMDEDTRKSFDKEEDDTKPTVLSATVIDSTTLRIQFSEDVKYSYATNVDNYELRNSNNVDLMTKSGVDIVASSSVDEDKKKDTDTYDIKFDDTSYKLNSSEYTLYVENIRDTASDANEMEDQTLTVDGTDDSSVDVDDIEAFRKSSTEVGIYFDSEMDEDSITDSNNYYYINGEGDSEDLPDDVDITASDDNKSVVIDFDDTNLEVYTTSGAPDDEDAVKKIGVKTVKDAASNDTYPGSLEIENSSKSGPELEEDTFKLSMDDDDVEATFNLTSSLDNKNVNDFKITNAAGKVVATADGIDTDGDEVTLTFNEGDSADAVIALGSSAVLKIDPSTDDPSTDIAGREIQPDTQELYYNEIGPVTDTDHYSAVATVDATGAVTSAVVNITMKTPVNKDILGSYRDDFELTDDDQGKTLEVSSVDIKTTTVVEDGKEKTEPTLVFTIKNADEIIKVGDNIDITVNSDEDEIDLESEEDGAGDNAKFVPSDDDEDITTVTVTSTITKTALNSSISRAEGLTKDDYTEASWATMSNALDTARTMAADSSATQAKVYNAQTTLDSAVTNLVSIKTLNTLIQTAKNLAAANYTDATWKNMQMAFTAAQTVAVTKDAAKTAVETATTALTAAINGLLPIVIVEQVSTTEGGETSVVASLPEGINANKYSLTIDGTALSYDSSTNKFALTIDGTFTVAQIQGKITVTAK